MSWRGSSVAARPTRRGAEWDRDPHGPGRRSPSNRSRNRADPRSPVERCGVGGAEDDLDRLGIFPAAPGSSQSLVEGDDAFQAEAVNRPEGARGLPSREDEVRKAGGVAWRDYLVTRGSGRCGGRRGMRSERPVEDKRHERGRGEDRGDPPPHANAHRLLPSHLDRRSSRTGHHCAARGETGLPCSSVTMNTGLGW
jgi:hypothetical protein